MVTGKTSDLMGATAAALLNALKHMAGIDEAVHLVSPAAIEPIQAVKVGPLGSTNPRLHSDEIIIALGHLGHRAIPRPAGRWTAWAPCAGARRILP